MIFLGALRLVLRSARESPGVLVACGTVGVHRSRIVSVTREAARASAPSREVDLFAQEFIG
jgi:hypothetical protein